MRSPSQILGSAVTPYNDGVNILLRAVKLCFRDIAVLVTRDQLNGCLTTSSDLDPVPLAPVQNSSGWRFNNIKKFHRPHFTTVVAFAREPRARKGGTKDNQHQPIIG
ncbi:hypothetical protein BcDW1_6814 [Botrytis cinerea BcDW1]|uniref:Uncharacterized protein n=1 Tax=Botryotinia fuckeliana (strain BcDW1) TaxID=1290391 RepID=M7TTG7_BOTF1|nr:hypothetical protein BcDW1_6814 [Botrytis cinerea BcDW1]